MECKRCHEEQLDAEFSGIMPDSGDPPEKWRQDFVITAFGSD
jgi:hypothetical protein